MIFPILETTVQAVSYWLHTNRLHYHHHLRCDRPRHNPCTMQCKLPIAMQTDECRRQYEDFSLDEHAAVDNAMHCDAIFNEQYAKCSPYSKMQRALKYKFTQCKP